MAVTTDEVRRLARLARLAFSPDEEARMATEMGAILAYMQQLGEVDTAGVAPLHHVFDLENVFRADAPVQRITRDEALENAPDHDGTYFRVPKVIG